MFAMLCRFKNYILRSFFEDYDRWVIFPFVLFCFGTAIYFVLPFSPKIWSVRIVSLALIIVFSLIYYISKKKSEIVALHFTKNLVLLVMCFFLGMLSICESIQSSNTVFLKERFKKTFVSGRVLRVENLDGQYRFLLDRVWIPDMPKDELPSRLRIRTFKPTLYPKAGQYVKFSGNLSPPATTPTLSGFNFTKYAYFHEIGGTGGAFWYDYHTKMLTSKYRLPDSLSDKFMFQVENLRRDINLRIAGNLPVGDTRQIAYALITGERYAAGFKLSDKFLAVGVTHILSISGFHMGIIAFLTFFLIRLLLVRIKPIALRYDVKKVSLLASIVPITFYLLITGARLPTVRAYLMTLIFILAMACDRKAFSKRTVFIAAFLIVLISPASIINPGFLMSFASVLALISMYENFPYYAKISKRAFWAKKNDKSSLIVKTARRIFYFFYLNLLTNMTAWLFILPFASFFFQKISFITILSNFVIVPIFSLFIMPMILLFYLTYPIHFVSDFVLKLVSYGIDTMLAIINWLTSWYPAPMQLPALPIAFIWIVSFGLLWLFIWKSNWRKFGYVIVASAFITLFFQRRADFIVSYGAGVFTFKTDDGELGFKNIRRGKMSNYTLVSIMNEYGFAADKLKKFYNNGKEFCAGSYCDLVDKQFRILYLTDSFKYKKLPKELDGNYCKYNMILNFILSDDSRDLLKTINKCPTPPRVFTAEELKRNIATEFYFDRKNSKIEVKSFYDMAGHFVWNQ